MKAAVFRQQVLPDRMVGGIAAAHYNRELRAGWYKSSVCDRAAIALRALELGYSPELMVSLRDACYLTGTLDLAGTTPEMWEAAAFPPITMLGTRLAQGQLDDTAYAYHLRLLQTFEQFKILRGVLHYAELVDVAPLPVAHPRRRRVIGSTHQAVCRLMRTAGSDGNKVGILIADATTGFADFPPLR